MHCKRDRLLDKSLSENIQVINLLVTAESAEVSRIELAEVRSQDDSGYKSFPARFLPGP